MSKGRLRVISVLSPEYFADAHIKGSINVPLGELKDFAQHTDKQTPLVVYCASYECSASTQAWHILHELGFQELYAYEGGMNEWFHAGLPMEGSAAQEYLKTPTEASGASDSSVQRIDMYELQNKMQRDGLL